MGAGVHILRALRTRLWPATLVLTAGCLDFVEPDIPDRGGAAVLQATVVLSDTGIVDVQATLDPGLDREGVRRPVRGVLRVMGRDLVPDTVLPNGTRRFSTAWDTTESVTVGPVELRSAHVEGVAASPPEIRWEGIRKLDADTLHIAQGDDLRLVIARSGLAEGPQPEIRQWFLRLAGAAGGFGLSADGPPPDTLYIPSRWIPAGEYVDVRLIYQQFAVLKPAPEDYLGLVTADIRLFWTVHVSTSGADRNR